MWLFIGTMLVSVLSLRLWKLTLSRLLEFYDPAQNVSFGLWVVNFRNLVHHGPIRKKVIGLWLQRMKSRRTEVVSARECAMINGCVNDIVAQDHEVIRASRCFVLKCRERC